MKHAAFSNAVFGQVLRGTKFPATRDELLDRARENDAPEDTLAVLELMPDDDTYNNMADVWVNTPDAIRTFNEQRLGAAREGRGEARESGGRRAK